jgi:hypothetical protein
VSINNAARLFLSELLSGTMIRTSRRTAMASSVWPFALRSQLSRLARDSQLLLRRIIGQSRGVGRRMSGRASGIAASSS